MKTLEPILIDTSLRFGQADIMHWFPEVDEHDAQSALVAAQEAADASFKEKWSDSTWMLDFSVSRTRHVGMWKFQQAPMSEPVTEEDHELWSHHFHLNLADIAEVIRSAAYQKPLIEHILREIEETRTSEAVEQGRW